MEKILSIIQDKLMVQHKVFKFIETINEFSLFIHSI